jgi:hypothetical protein
MTKPGKTDLKDLGLKLMDLDEIYDDIFDSQNRGKGSHSMDNMPPDAGNQSFQKKMMNENMERQKQSNPLSGKLRKNVNMMQAMNGGGLGQMGHSSLNGGMEGEMQGVYSTPVGGSLMSGGMVGQHFQRNSGSIYPSDPRMRYPVEVTNSSFNEDEMGEIGNIDSQNYRYGPRSYALDRNNKHNHSYNSYDSLEGFSDRRLNCLDVANHVKSCPICSKFYDNDKTMYIVAIIILVIICIILMKKVLENYEK